MKKPQCFKLFFVVAMTFVQGCLATSRDAIVTVRIIDDEGKPINAVRSTLAHTDTFNAKTGFTDADGMYSDELTKIFAQIGGWFEKPGYYKSSGKFWGWSSGLLVPPADTNFTVVLKRIIDPVPMVYKKIAAYSPRPGEPVGFDLEIGDWVHPDGKGKITDMLITATKNYMSANEFSFSLSVEFIGEENGIQPFYYPSFIGAGYPLKSEFPPPQIAPELGYLKNIEHFSKKIPTERRAKNSLNENISRIFRVRTVLDEEGKIVSANYGWSFKDIYIESKPGDFVGFSFTYYYNSDSKSRSLEPKEIADRQAKN